MKTSLLILSAAVLVGCRTGSTPAGTQADSIPTSQSLLVPPRTMLWRTVSMFDFLQSGLSTSAVSNRIGAPDRQLGSGQLRMEYDLWDTSEMVIFVKWDSSRSVAWWGQRRGTNWLWTKPEGYK